MEQFKNRALAVTLGMVLAYASVVIAGIGAAITLPSELLKPLAHVSGLLAFTMVDFFTIAIPLAAAFMLTALLSQWVNKKPDVVFYVLLLTPVVVLQLYFVLQTEHHLVYATAISLPRFILLAICFYVLARSTTSAND